LALDLAENLEREVIALRAIKDDLLVALRGMLTYWPADRVEDGFEDGTMFSLSVAWKDVRKARSAIEKAHNV
jgi:hypothetical protein